MSQTIELKDDVFTKLKQNAERDGVTAEVWIETVVEEKSNGESLPIITDEAREHLHEFHRRTERKLGEMWQKKFRGQLTEFNERNID